MMPRRLASTLQSRTFNQNGVTFIFLYDSRNKKVSPVNVFSLSSRPALRESLHHAAHAIEKMGLDHFYMLD